MRVICYWWATEQNNESARKRTLAQALRFVAHINGASLLFCSSKEKNLKDMLRTTLNTVRSVRERTTARGADHSAGHAASLFRPCILGLLTWFLRDLSTVRERIVVPCLNSLLLLAFSRVLDSHQSTCFEPTVESLTRQIRSAHWQCQPGVIV